jgi:putative FmdB family regulatory protein
MSIFFVQTLSVKIQHMPIYEYRCTKCHRKTSIFWRSISAVDQSKARCSHCESAELTRLVSKVRVIRGGSKSSSDGVMPGGGDMDATMMNELGGLDENDPRSLGRFMRKMASETGEQMGPEFDEIVGRLEKGEDPERIEQSMGDMFGDGEGGEMGGMGGMGGMMDDDMGMPPMGPPPEATDPADKASAKPEAKAPQRAVRKKTHASAAKKTKSSGKKKSTG